MSLRSQALRGGAYLSIREGMGIGIRLVGTLVITRLIGPTNYGLYAGALAAVSFLALVAQLGVGVYVIRLEEHPTEEIYHTVFTVVLITTAITIFVSLLISVAISGSVISAQHIAPFQVLLLALPLNVLWTPAQAKLEHGMRFRRMAWLEIGGDIVLYAVSISLAVAGFGVWAPVVGYVGWQAWLLLTSYLAASYRPRIRWERRLVRDMVGYGVGYSSGTWIYQTRELCGPLVVGSMLGPEALGYTALAARIGETLCFVSRATWRLSMVVLGRVQDNLARLATALQEAMALQVVALGPILGSFALVSNLVVPRLFGTAWEPTTQLIPLVLFGYMMTSVFNMEATVLYVRRENSTMIITNILRIALLFGVAVILVPVIGILGWAVAMAVHPLGFLWCDRKVRKLLDIQNGPLIYWLVAFLPPLFVPYVGWPIGILLCLPTVIVCSTRWARGKLREYASYGMAAIRRSNVQAEAPAQVGGG